MKIFHICFAPVKPDGIKGVLKKLFPAQLNAGHDVHVLSLTDAEPDFEHSNSVGYFHKKIRTERPDIVIFHSVYFNQYLIYALLLWLYRIPYAIQLHGALSKENYKVNNKKKKIANFLVYKRFIKGAKGIIYLNPNEYKNSIVKDINPRYVIIPNGCDEVVDANVDHNVSESFINYIYIGRIERRHKGVDLLVDAIKGINESSLKDKVRFHFYGDGRDTECAWFKEQLQHISDIAEFHGPVYDEKKDMAMRASDIFVLTSRSEGMPMAVLEAHSYGTPCLITMETNMGDAITEAGAGWITGADVEDIIRNIEAATQCYESDPHAFRGRAYELSKRYYWTRIAHESVEKYKQLLTF
jgi:glycosyltransferase involved in cell wall biosynthesis